mmetsp:Transcript_119860/g.339737  ORF Transcript_119860/g.339737 Transcript_119860/m.339737 type:complete len:206 (-) Transcript_119860:157-774(-)
MKGFHTHHISRLTGFCVLCFESLLHRFCLLLLLLHLFLNALLPPLGFFCCLSTSGLQFGLPFLLMFLHCLFLLHNLFLSCILLLLLLQEACRYGIGFALLFSYKSSLMCLLHLLEITYARKAIFVGDVALLHGSNAVASALIAPHVLGREALQRAPQLQQPGLPQALQDVRALPPHLRGLRGVGDAFRNNDALRRLGNNIFWFQP